MTGLDLKAIALVVCALAPTSVVGFVAFNQTQTLKTETGHVTHRYMVHEKLDRILTDVTEAETSVRGFTITGKDDFLNLYFSAAPKVETHLDELTSLVSDEPEQEAKLKDLDGLVHEKVDRLESIIMARKQSGFDSAAGIVKDGKGREIMVKIRKVIQEMEAVENKREHTLNSSEGDSAKLVRVAIVLTIFALTLAGINLFFLRLR